MKVSSQKKPEEKKPEDKKDEKKDEKAAPVEKKDEVGVRAMEVLISNINLRNVTINIKYE